MYKLTDDPNMICNTATGTYIPQSHPLWQEYEAWLAAGNTPEAACTLPEARRKKTADVKTEAARRILAIAPEWKQRNLMARAVELQEMRANGNLSTEEQAELDAIRAEWDRIKAVRAASDAIEAEIRDEKKHPTAEAVLAVDVAGHPLWP